MDDLKIYRGIPIGKRYDEYTKEELSVLPPIPNYKKGVDYPDWCEVMPLYWVGYKWDLAELWD